MTSRRATTLLRFTTAAAVSMALSGCSYFGDSKRSSGHMKVQTTLSCFNQVGETLTDYVDGRAPLAQMDSLIDCTNKSIDEFTSKVRGSQGRTNTYNRNDINVFLDQYLLTSGKFDHKLLEMLFDLKASSVGGDEGSLSPSDIAKMKALLSDVKASMHDVDPYLGVLTRREKLDARNAKDQARLEQSLSALRSAMRRLMPYFSSSNLRQKTFTMDEGFDLLASLGLDMKKYAPYKDLSRVSKQILVGGSPDIIAAEEWLTLIKRAVDGFAIYLRYQTMIAPLPITEPSVTPQLHLIADDALDFAAKSLRHQSGQQLSEAQLTKLIEGLATAKALPSNIAPTAIIGFVPTILEKWLLDRTVVKPISSRGLGEPELKTLANLVQNWLDGMDMLKAVSPNETISQEQLKQAVLAEVAKPANAGDSPLVAHRKKLVAREWADIYTHGRAWAWDTRGFVMIAPARALPPLHRRNLMIMNIWRVVGEAVLRAYATDPDRTKTLAGLTVGEVQQVYVDIRGVSDQLHLIDSRTLDAGTRTFMETNLFTSVANGDNLMQYREAIDWINSAVSSTTQANAIFADIEKRCPATGANDLMGHRQIEIECFRSQFRNGFTTYFENDPALVVFFKTHLQDDASWTDFIKAFENIARPAGAVGGAIEVGSLRTLVTVIGYNETLLQRFDKDEDQILTDKELWNAFPLVQPLIRDAMMNIPEAPLVRGACLPDPILPTPKPSAAWLQKAVFAYLIRNGQPPPASGMGTIGIPFALAQTYVLNTKISRLELIKIIASFTTVNKQKQAAQIAAFYKVEQPVLASDYAQGVCSVVRKTLQLFKCDPLASSDFVSFVRRRGAQIFTPSITTPEAFTQALEQGLQNDARMRKVCLPF